MSIFKRFPHYLYSRLAWNNHFCPALVFLTPFGSCCPSSCVGCAGADDDDDDDDADAFAFGLVLGVCPPSTLSISIRLGVRFLRCFVVVCVDGFASSLF